MTICNAPRFGIALLLLAGLITTTLARAALEAEPLPEQVEFNAHIRPLFVEHCTACHGGVKQAGKLSFVYREKVLEARGSREAVVHPGDPTHSEVIYRVTTEDEDDRMPPPEHGAALSEREIALLNRWIQQGAEWEEHWAFRLPKPQAIPAVQNDTWNLRPLDAFILARLEAERLQPSPPADRVQWLRRVTFDLTGLPPVLEELDAFGKDGGEDAFEKVVDRLLDSKQFGERWAAKWMDLARYADSQGYEKDNPRTLWPYRDWVIRAFNSDMPFDEFTVRQIAGDLLPDASTDDMCATAFHRNTPTNAEGGSDDEEFRVAAVVDRVNTTWQAWQGLTFGCTQCHSHPYDAFEHQDYYRFLAAFNTSQDWDLTEDWPHLAMPMDSGENARARELDLEMARLRQEEVEASRGLANDASLWSPLKLTKASASGQTRLSIRQEEGRTEVLTGETVTIGSRFTLETRLPAGTKTLTALKVEAMPVNPEVARLTPELGFVVTQVRGWLMPAIEPAPGAQGPPYMPEVRFNVALGDEAIPFLDDSGTLNPNRQGWGALPRLTHPRHLVLLPDLPVDLSDAAGLLLQISHDYGPEDMAPLVMNRSRYSISDSSRWTTLKNSSDFKARRNQIAKARQERGRIKSVSMPVMVEQEPDQRRATAMFVRGNWLDKGEEVGPGIPTVFGSLPEGSNGDRLAIAEWLVSPENPLTARVAVNRFWEQLFGVGLVETLEDFGSSGRPPSHPELLDYLALRFQNELGWSVKALLREMVLSATYRQDARVTETLSELDPRNRLLTRGPRNRLTSEMVRDNALAVSGLLAEVMYGPPVMPPQPEGVWRVARSKVKWEESQGADKHRRAIYTFMRRSTPYPSFATFDSPQRTVCAARRLTTNTPLQALVTLNDPVYVECAVALAGRMMAEGGDTPVGQIECGYRLATGYGPSSEQAGALRELHETALTTYANDPDLAKTLGGSAGQSALTLVANAILNSDAVLTK